MSPPECTWHCPASGAEYGEPIVVAPQSARPSRPVVLFGIGDFAEVAHVYLREDSHYDVVGATVHERYLPEQSELGIPLVPFERIDAEFPPAECAMFVAIGFSKLNRQRTAVYDECKRRGYELITYVSSRASVIGEIEIGDNCFVFEENVIQPFVKIGNNVVVWSGNHIGHHSVIEDNCFIASHAVISGRVRIGRNSFIGVNATFRDGVTIAADCVIGAGALINEDTVEGAVYRGARAELSSRRSHELKL